MHQGAQFPQHELQFAEEGVGGEAADVRVRCLTCNTGRALSEAFEKTYVIPCSGRRPQLRDVDPTGCRERMRPILLGASNSWFPISLSALTIPQQTDKLPQKVDEHWALLQKATSIIFLQAWRASNQLNAFAKYTDEQIWAAIEAKRSGGGGGAGSEDLKTPEYRVSTNPSAANSGTWFRVREVPAPAPFSWCFERVVLAERLREIRALIGFTRIESPFDADGGAVPADRRGQISRLAPKWVPASETRGEGLFLQFRESEIEKWVKGNATRDAEFFGAHKQWRALRRIPNPEAGYSGLRFTLLHSFAHSLIRQFALECGYSAASLRERIYSKNPDEEDGPMAGILIYTAAPDSEGTLGGLVALGEPVALGRHIEAALVAMRLCTSDPLCAEHNPPQDGLTRHGAACHACLFASETSCERGNRYLDRSVLVPTVERSDLAFFRD